MIVMLYVNGIIGTMEKLTIELSDSQIKHIKQHIYSNGIGFMPNRKIYNSITELTNADIVSFIQNYLDKFEY